MNTTLSLPVSDTTQAGAARRAAAEWAYGYGWSEEMMGRVALVVTELGRNLALHTSAGGALLIRRLCHAEATGVEILSLDSGPGVANFNRCMRDGYSTAGTPGTGLGAVQRVSQFFNAYSQEGIGTAIVSQLWAKPPETLVNGRWLSSGVSVPLATEIVCGDSWTEQSGRADTLRVMVADGLGHGDFAAQAANRAGEIFIKYPGLEIAAVLENMHLALGSTRGAAVAIAELDLARKEVSFVGVGNILGAILGHERMTHLVSLNGTVGAQCRTIRTFTYPWPDDGVLVMASDGIRSHWQMERYPGLVQRHPSLLAGVLYRDYVRGRDDATVVVVRQTL